MSNYTERVKALRHCMTKEDGITICEPCPYYGKGIDCENVLHTDAAAAIEELQAQLSKRGEWIITAETSDDGAVSHHMNCSVCGFYWREPKHRKVFKRCPNCGAKMEAQISNSFLTLK